MDQIATVGGPAAKSAASRLTLKTPALPKVHSGAAIPLASAGGIVGAAAKLAAVLCLTGTLVAAAADAQQRPQQPPRARLGAVVATPPELAREGFPPRQPRGAWITEVQPGSPAEVAGLRPGDLIVAVQGRVITSVRDLVDILASGAPGDALRVQYTRDEAFKASQVILAGPDGMAQQSAAQPPAAAASEAPSLLGGIGSMFSGLLSGQAPPEQQPAEPAEPATQRSAAESPAEPLPPPKPQTPLEFLSLPASTPPSNPAEDNSSQINPAEEKTGEPAPDTAQSL